MQTDRRNNPYPFTWEIPAGIVAATGLLLVLGVHLGRGIANWFADAGWRWPPTTALLTSLPAVLSGDANAGLDSALSSAASPAQVLGWVTAAEAVLLVASTVLVVVALRRWGPGRLRGMATPAEAEASLGLSRLRRVRHIIRPDLRPAHRRHTASGTARGAIHD